MAEDAAAAYGAYLERLAQVQDLASGGEPATGDFDAAIQDTSPAWLSWPDDNRVWQAEEYIMYWDPNDAAGLLAAYQDFASQDPHAAGAAQVVGSLVDFLAPDASALARAGDIAGASAGIKKALAAYPGTKLDAKHAAQQIYALTLVGEGRTAAQGGDLEGAASKFKAALKLDSSSRYRPQD